MFYLKIRICVKCIFSYFDIIMTPPPNISPAEIYCGEEAKINYRISLYCTFLRVLYARFSITLSLMMVHCNKKIAF